MRNNTSLNNFAPRNYLFDGVLSLIKICVGTRNPSKIRGIEKAFNLFFGEIMINSYDIEGLTPQPLGLVDIKDSAKQRVLRIREKDPFCDYYVGVEAGLIELKGLGYFDVHIAYVLSRDGFESYGFSPAFQVPMKFVDKILSGEFRELEEVVDHFFKTRGIGERGGLISVLSRGILVREELVYYSVATALLPLINKSLYYNE